MICGHRVEGIEDPLMQRIRWMDELADELARGKRMTAVLRGGDAAEDGSGSPSPARPGG